ncbi:M28 family peptidase [Algibacter miyuki]|uniref:M28 family peptidase n=1 Tax=Algibacter miyuki TaxID=1306933 RepID=A0ABV5GUR3_9FLAO|nr:M28 family peptidase [Algibacter miyuki]MDN3664698.1 M28 family peptidase [Algibacter miyuki]
MPKFLTIIISICLLFSIEGNSQICTNADALFSKTALLKHLKSLSSDAFEGRRTGTDGGIKARKYIVNQFYSLDVLPLVQNYEQAFQFSRSNKDYDGVNVLGLIKGSGFEKKYIVISAHYDHEGVKRGKIYNGADDNASGVSALFSFAEYLKKYPPKHSVILAAFDAEELGLKGSEYFVKTAIMTNNNVVLNMNMDMIGRSHQNELFVVGTAYNEILKNMVSEVEISKKIKLVKGHDGFDGLENWTYSSDHANFHKKKVPFLYFGVADHEDYHEPTDDFENIQPEFYIHAVETIMKVFEKIDQSGF